MQKYGDGAGGSRVVQRRGMRRWGGQRIEVEVRFGTGFGR